MQVLCVYMLCAYMYAHVVRVLDKDASFSTQILRVRAQDTHVTSLHMHTSYQTNVHMTKNTNTFSVHTVHNHVLPIHVLLSRHVSVPGGPTVGSPGGPGFPGTPSSPAGPSYNQRGVC